MKNWDISASDTQAARAKLSKRLYTNLERAGAELDRRSDILQRSPHGAAHAAAWDRFMRASDARATAVKVLQQNHFHEGNTTSRTIPSGFSSVASATSNRRFCLPVTRLMSSSNLRSTLRSALASLSQLA